MPKNCNEEEQLKRKEIYFGILQYMVEDKDFLTSVLTCNETCLFQQPINQMPVNAIDINSLSNIRIQNQENACHLHC